MENIIQQIAEKLIHKILERAYSGGISDIDALSSDVLGDCREAAIGIVEAITAGLNHQIRDDKERRKAEGLVLKEKERDRSLLTDSADLIFQETITTTGKMISMYICWIMLLVYKVMRGSQTE